MVLVTNYKSNSYFHGHADRQSTAFCAQCGTLVRSITPQETEEEYQANWVELARLTEQGIVHRIEAAEDGIRICVNSLRGLRRPLSRRYVVLKPCAETFE